MCAILKVSKKLLKELGKSVGNNSRKNLVQDGLLI
jgi:hypothetical protein